MDTTPSNNHGSALFILAGVLAITLLLGLLPSRWFGIKQTGLGRAPLDLSSETVNDLATDTNGDGTVDWNEIIKQTFGDEIDTQTINEGQVDPQAVQQLNDPNNLTATLAKNFYLASAYIDKNGVTDDATKSTISQNLLQEVANKLTYTSYAIGDLSLDRKETSASIKLYGNKLGTLMQKAVSANLATDDLKDYKSYIDTQDSLAFKRLQAKRDAATSIASALQAMSVPLSASPLHVVLLNKVNAYATTLDNMLQVANDPVRASIAYKRYVSDTSDMLRAAGDFSTYFKTKQTVFSQKEAGYIFH